jgi:hypothetical protein
MNKIFAALMTAMIIATVIAVFALGFLSLTGGPVKFDGDEADASMSSDQPDDGAQ